MAYDALAGELLSQSGIQVTDTQFYFANEWPYLQELGALAHRLSTRWFHDVPARSCLARDARVEHFFIRTFTFCFLAVLRAYFLLEKIRRIEGQVKLLTTEVVPGYSRSIRWKEEESPIPLLLKHCNDGWGFSHEIRPVATTSSGPPDLMGYDWLSPWISRLREPFKKGDVLFSGNPSLLASVQGLLRRASISSLKIRNTMRLRDVLFAFHPGYLTLRYPSQFPNPAMRELVGFKEALASRGTFRVGDVDLLPVVWHKLEYFYQFEAPRARAFYEDAVRVLERVRPKMLVVDEDVTEMNRTLVMAANQLAIPTLVVLHGLPGCPLGFVPLEANYMAAWGKEVEKVLAGWGVDPTRIVSTGCPKYDPLCHTSRSDGTGFKRDMCRKLGLDPAKRLALVIPGAFRENALEIQEPEETCTTAFEILKTAKYIHRLAQEIPEINWIFKFRFVVAKTGRWVHHIVERWCPIAPNLRWITEGLAVDYIKAADLVFNSISSAGFEAILLKKPLVEMNFSGQEDPVSLVFNAGVARASGYDDLAALCRRFARGTLPLDEWLASQERLVAPSLFSRDGKSSERVADLILAVLKNQGSRVAPLVPTYAEA